MTKRISYVLLLLLFIGAAMAYAYRTGKIRAELEVRYDSLATAKRGVDSLLIELGRQNDSLILLDAERADTAGQLDSALQQARRTIARRTDELEQFLGDHEHAVPDTLFVLIRRRLAADSIALEVCTEGLELCRRRLVSKDAQIAMLERASAVQDSVLEAQGNLLDDYRKELYPGFDLPRFAFNFGRNAAALYGLYCGIRDLASSESGSSSSDLQLYRPFDSRRALIRIDLRP